MNNVMFNNFVSITSDQGITDFVFYPIPNPSPLHGRIFPIIELDLNMVRTWSNLVSMWEKN